MRDQSHIINFVEIKKVTETGGIGGKPNRFMVTCVSFI